MRRGCLLATVVLLALPVDAGAAARPRCLGHRATIVGTSGGDSIAGSSSNDVIVAGAGPDRVVGGGGADLICGGRGNDRLDGAKGDDLLHGGEGNDALAGGRGGDDTIGAGGADALRGGEKNDWLFGGPGNDKLLGGAGGTDRLFGGSGADALRGGDGFLDVVDYRFAPAGVQADLASGASTGDGADTLAGLELLIGSSFDDRLSGSGQHTEQIEGRDGDDMLFGRGGRFDRILGGSGNDVLDGGSGENTVSFERSQNGVIADLELGAATGEGVDVLTGFVHVDGSNFQDRLSGSASQNFIHGGDEADHLEGRAGDDFLTGEGGQDTYDGGPGEDWCERNSHGEPTPCETDFVTDSMSLATMEEPDDGEVAEAESFERAHGEITPSDFGGGYATRVRFGLRRLTPNGCSWWSGASSGLVARACGSERWLEAEVSRARHTWRYAFGAALPRGQYMAFAFAFDGGDPSPWRARAELRLT